MMRQRLLATALFLLLFLGAGKGESKPDPTLLKYGAEKGLPVATILDIAEDENGYLLLALNGGGFCRYDGKTFDCLDIGTGLTHMRVSTLHLDSLGNTWLGTGNGITKIDKLGNISRFYPFPNNPNRNWVRNIFTLRGAIYFFTEGSVLGKIDRRGTVSLDSSFVDRGIRRYLQVRGIDCFLQGRTGLVSIQSLAPDGLVPLLFTGAPFEFLGDVLDCKQGLLLGTNRGIYTYSEGQYRLHPSGLDKPVLQLVAHKELLYARTPEGIYEVRPDTSFLVMSTPDQTTGMLVDRAGHLWVASLNGLLKHVPGNAHRALSQADGLPENIVMAIEKVPDGFAIGTATKGLAFADDQFKVQHRLSLGDEMSRRNAVRSLYWNEREKALWVGTYDGIFSVKDQVVTNLNSRFQTQQLPVRVIKKINHKLAIATQGKGVLLYDEATESITTITRESGLNHNNTYSLVALGDTILVGTEFGVNLLWQNQVFPFLPQLDEFSISSITPLTLGGSRLLLIGTYGAGAYLAQLEQQKVIAHYSKDNYLSGNLVFFVEARYNKLFIGTENGINVLSLSDTGQVVESIRLNKHQGISEAETNLNATSWYRQYLLLGNLEGVQILYVDSLPGRQERVPLHFTDVQINDQKAVLTDFEKKGEVYIFPDSVNRIVLSFRSINKYDPEGIKYAYWISSGKGTSSGVSTNNYIVFSSLAPGTYEFRCQALQYGMPMGEPVLFSFQIAPAFYESKLFVYGILVSLIGLMLLLFYIRSNARINKVLVLEQLKTEQSNLIRKRIAQDFHDELGNQLVRIINYVNVLKLQNKDQSFDRQLDKVTQSAKALYQGTKSFIWSLNPENDRLDNLFIYLKDFGEKLFEEKGILFRTSFEGDRTLKLPQGYSREIALILKEGMTNVFKHSQANKVQFNIKVKPEFLEIVLLDDGVGIGETAAGPTQNGVQNMQLRANRIAASLMLQSSQEGPGTQLCLSIPRSHV